ncbi:MAG TPA: hypothetical protein VLF67_00625 [Candidatus Saccharimonas sp.]|nr:hypothetical protein [Candidatus Saccharimonas sp.]
MTTKAIVQQLLDANTIPVREHRWVTIVNPDGNRNGNGLHEFGERASINTPGRLSVVCQHEGLTLMRYDTSQPVGGACAGNGALFFVTAEELAELQ